MLIFTEKNNLNCSTAEKYIQSLASLVPFVMCHLHMNTSMEPCNDTMNARQTEQLLSMLQEWFWNINFIMLSWRLQKCLKKMSRNGLELPYSIYFDLHVCSHCLYTLLLWRKKVWERTMHICVDGRQAETCCNLILFQSWVCVA